MPVAILPVVEKRSGSGGFTATGSLQVCVLLQSLTILLCTDSKHEHVQFMNNNNNRLNFVLYGTMEQTTC